MKAIVTLFIALSIFSCSKKKLTKAERKEIEHHLGQRRSDLENYQLDRYKIDESIEAAEQRIVDLKHGKYKLSDEEVEIEVGLAEQDLRKLKAHQQEVIGVIEQAHHEVDSLDLLLKK